MFTQSRRAFLGASLTGLASMKCLWADEPANKAKERDDAPFQPSTLFLTWQRDPTSTMTVQWVGTVGETPDTTISYSRLKDDSWQTKETTTKPYPMSDLKVFRAELAGLSPATDYRFRIGKESPIYRFRTMPAKATNIVSFISGGDCGVNAHAISNNIQAARHDPMFAIIGGDLGYDNGQSVAVSLAFLRNYSKHMVARDGRLIPMVTCIGNHEVDGGYAKPRANAPFFYALFDGLFRATGFASLDFGDYLSLMLLDTGHTTPIGGAQADWLGRTLKARVDHPNVLAVNHVPAYPSFRRFEGENGKEGTGESNRKYWVPLFEKYRVPVVLEHHDHTFKRTKPLLDG
jgi:phosphodiesterase/alkaline phosphatase D-like protein